MPEIQVPAPPVFAACVRGHEGDWTLKVCNTSAGNLIVSGITSSNPDFTVVAPSADSRSRISHDFCFPFQVGFTPTSPGPKTRQPHNRQQRSEFSNVASSRQTPASDSRRRSR